MKMRNFEREWAARIMDTIIPPGVVDKIPQSASETGSVKVVEDMVKYSPFLPGFGFRAVIWLIEILGPLVASLKPSRFSSLDPAGRELVLNKLYKSKIYLIRQLIILFKMTACFGWGMDPAVKAALGASGEPKFVKRSG